MIEDLRYPIGHFDRTIEITPRVRDEFVKTILALPQRLNAAVLNLNERQLDTPYRPGGWTIRQTVHHIADSHLNSFVRFKLALTENTPTVRPYYEDRWAELPDSFMPLDVSLKIVEGLHLRWGKLLMEMSDEDYKRELVHPETGAWTLCEMLALYDWHSRHHTAHITNLRTRNNW